MLDIFFLLRGGRHMYYLFENIVILPYYCLIDLYAKSFLWFVTFAKVECCQITETCGINWEDSVIVEPI